MKGLTSPLFQLHNLVQHPQGHLSHKDNQPALGPRPSTLNSLPQSHAVDCAIKITAQRSLKQGMKWQASFSTQGDYGRRGPSTHYTQTKLGHWEGKKTWIIIELGVVKLKCSSHLLLGGHSRGDNLPHSGQALPYVGDWMTLRR